MSVQYTLYRRGFTLRSIARLASLDWRLIPATLPVLAKTSYKQNVRNRAAIFGCNNNDNSHFVIWIHGSSRLCNGPSGGTCHSREKVQLRKFNITINITRDGQTNFHDVHFEFMYLGTDNLLFRLAHVAHDQHDRFARQLLSPSNHVFRYTSFLIVGSA